MKKSSILLILSIVLISSCKDKEDVQIVRDTVKPSITILSPSDGQTITGSEQVSITGNISDNRALKEVAISVSTISGDEIFNYSLSESDFSKSSRMKITHHGPHNLVDITNMVLDTFFIAPSSPGTLELKAEAADYDGNVSKSILTLN